MQPRKPLPPVLEDGRLIRLVPHPAWLLERASDERWRLLYNAEAVRLGLPEIAGASVRAGWCKDVCSEDHDPCPHGVPKRGWRQRHKDVAPIGMALVAGVLFLVGFALANMMGVPHGGLLAFILSVAWVPWGMSWIDPAPPKGPIS